MYDLQAPCFLSNWLIFQRRVVFCPITTTSSIVPPFIGFSFASQFFHPSLSFLSWRSHALSAVNQQAEGMFPRVWGAESPPRLPVNEHPAGCLFNRENLALRENNSPSSCVSPAAVAAANHPARSIGELITPTIMHGVILSVGKIG